MNSNAVYLETISESTHTTFKASRAIVYQLSSEKWSSHYTLFPTVITQQYENNCLNRTSAIKTATMKITDDFCYEWHMPTTKLTLFVVSKDEWNTKEGTSKSMKSTLHVQRYGKKHFLGWRTSNSKNIKPIARAIVELKASVSHQ